MLGFALRRLAFGALTLLDPRLLPPTKRALAQAGPPTIDVPTLQALALWAAVPIVVMSVVADIALVRLDPRPRTTGSVPG
jgi:hypothetical protein